MFKPISFFFEKKYGKELEILFLEIRALCCKSIFLKILSFFEIHFRGFQKNRGVFSEK